MGMKKDEAFQVGYNELRALAGKQFSGERISHTLTPTALVNEVWLKMRPTETYRDRAHFFSIAATMMRQILTDYARTKGRIKRGGAYKRLGLDSIDIAAPVGETAFEPEDFVSLAEAIEQLEVDDPQLARLVELRFFASATIDEIAGVLQVSPRTVYNDWPIARAKLRALMER